MMTPHEYGLVRLRPNADTSHDTSHEWYDSYGAHESTTHYGDFDLQTVEYDWLDDEDDDRVAKRVLADLPAPYDDDDADELRSVAYALVRQARHVREAAESVCRELDAAVSAYRRGDLDAVVEHLASASDQELDHGDDPATTALMNELLQEMVRPSRYGPVQKMVRKGKDGKKRDRYPPQN